MQGCVYLLTDGEFFMLWFIWFLIEKRIRKLQTGNPDSIVIISHYDTDYPFKIESALHARHSHQRINNEWFNLTPYDIKNFKKECEQLDYMFTKIKDNPFL